MIQHRLYLYIFLILLMFFVGCQNKEQSTQHENNHTQVFSAKDALGNSVILKKYPQRIISLAPSNTEILFALGIGNRLVGRTRYCNYPPAVNSIPIVGGFVDINVERILTLKPDLVLAVRGNPQKILNEIIQLGITVFALDPTDIKDVVNTISVIGRITGQTVTSQKLIQELSDRIEHVTRRIQSIPMESRPRVFYGDWRPPIAAAGIDNPIDSLITMAGGINIARDSGISWPRYSFERILAHNPDVIMSGFKQENDLHKNPEQLKNEIRNDPLWSVLKAVRSNRVYFIDEDIVMRPGPRMVNALETMVRFFYPDLDKQDFSPVNKLKNARVKETP